MRFGRGLLAVLALAAALRFLGLDWDAGHAFHPDERRIAFALEELSLSPLQLNPRFFAYGSFPLYAQKLWTSAAALVTDSAEGFHGAILWGRALSALVGVALVGWLAFLGRRLYGPGCGLLAALFLALAVLPIQHAHFITVDLHQALLALAVLERLVAWSDTPARTGRLWAAAVLAGLTLATKVSSAPILLPLVLAPLLSGDRSWAGRLALSAGAVAIAVLAFALGQPYALLDHEAFLHDVREQSRMVREAGTVPYTIQYLGTRPWLDDLRQAFTWGTGPALGLAAAVGTLAALVRGVRERRAGEWLLLSFLVPYFAVTGAFPVKFMRYLLPLYPLWCLWAARLFMPARGARRLLAGGVVAATALYALGFATIYLRPHPWIEASAWFHRSVPEGATVLRPHWEEGFPVAVEGVPARRYETLELPLYEADGPRKTALLAERLAEGDVLVFPSKRLYGAITNAPERYPDTVRMLELLFAGDLGYHLERTFASRPALFGVEWNDDLADESFSVYDHPKTLIFRNGTRLDAAALAERLRARVPSRPLTRADILLAGAEARRPPPRAAGVRSSAAALALWTAALLALSFVGRRLLAWAAPHAPAHAVAGLAPAAGYLLFAWLSWLAAATGAATFSAGTVAAVAALLVLLAARGRPPEAAGVTGTLVLLASFAFFAAVRAFHPEIFWGEKPMDFAFLNALDRATSIPPPEPWLSGTTVNYPYFGHFAVAALGKLTHVAPALSFNLGVATVGALTAAAAFGAGALLGGGRVAVGLLAAALVAFAGNLSGVVEWAARRTFDFDYFWATSRVIEATINEFPLWSFLFADLHAHVMALPLATLLLGLVAAWHQGPRALPPALALLSALALGAIGTTSTWSLPVHAGALAGVGLVAALATRRPARLFFPLVAVPLAGLAFLPYWRRYVQPPGGNWGLEHAAAPASGILLVHGGFLVAMLVALDALARRRNVGVWPRLAVLVALAATFVLSPRLALGVLALLALAAAFLAADAPTRLAWVFGAGGTLLVVAADTVFFWDRMNTIFKLYLEAWILLALASAAWIVRLPPPRRAPLGAAALGVVGLLSAFTAATDVVAWLRSQRVDGPRPTLDGQAWLAVDRPAEGAAIEWINRNVAGTPVLLEAHGPPYREYGRISMHTGLPTVLGWEYHLFQRAQPWSELDARKADVATLWNGTDRRAVERLLRRYGVALVYVGHVERASVSRAGLAKLDAWDDLFQPIYRTEDVRIYAVPANFRWSGDVETPTLSPRAPPPPPPGVLHEPRGLAVTAAGKLWVADFGHDRLQAYGPDLVPLGTVGAEGGGPGELADPCAVAVGPDGHLYVADTWNHRVQVFDPSGEPLDTWSDAFFGPRGIAVAPDGTVWVTDTGNGRVARYRSDGARIVQYGKRGSGAGELREPVGIAVAPDGRVFVADAGNRRIVVLSAEGRLLETWSVPGWEPDARLEPHLAVLDDGRVAATDPSGDAVLVFAPDGRLLSTRTLAGGAHPSGIVAVAPDEVVIAEAGRHRLTRVPL